MKNINPLINNFIPIISYNNPNEFEISSISSGFLLFINNDIYLFGAFHSIVDNLKDVGNLNHKYQYIAAELYYEENKGACIIPFKLEQLNFSHAISLSKTISYIPDFFFVKIPKNEIYKLNSAKLVEDNKVIGFNKTHIFNKIVAIDINDKYAFAGNIKPKLKEIDTCSYIAKISELVCYTDLQYIKSDNVEKTYTFRLNESGKNIKDFKGCSGAPIVNSKNELVSIAIRVICKENEVEIVGINLKSYESLINIMINLPD